MAKIYRPQTLRVSAGTDALRHKARSVAIDQLLPRIAQLNHVAVETVRISLYFYSRIIAGRRCSCADIEVSPNTKCRCCYGTGVVGGFDKYGTNFFSLDVTHPNITTVNIIPDYSERERPRRFVLIPGAREGYLITKIQIQTNIGKIDTIYSLADVPEGGEIDAYIKAPSDLDWVSFSKENLEQRLHNSYIYVKIAMKRSSPIGESPRFGMVYVRYIRKSNMVVYANIPRKDEAEILQDFGVSDDFSSQDLWLDNTLRRITTEDWFAATDDSNRWKAISVKDMAPEGKLLSWDITARIIQPYESMAYFPL